MSEKKQPEAVLLGGIDLNNVKRLRRHQVQTEAREQMQRDTQDGWAYSWVTWNRDNAIAGQNVITYVELSEGDQDVVHLWVHNYDDEGDAESLAEMTIDASELFDAEHRMNFELLSQKADQLERVALKVN